MPQLPEEFARLIDCIRDQDRSVREMMGAMHFSNRENFLKRYLDPAIDAGVVTPLYPDSPRHPRQKYRLTVKGLALLQAQK